MTVILDTNALIWFVDGDKNLGSTARRTIDEALWERSLFVSSFSFWEIGMLLGKGRLRMEVSARIWHQTALSLGIEEIPLTGGIGILSTELQGLPNDPADRIIFATALSIGGSLITADGRLLRWDGPLDRYDARV